MCVSANEDMFVNVHCAYFMRSLGNLNLHTAQLKNREYQFMNLHTAQLKNRE